MTCYMSHMDWLFEALELPSDTEQRRRVDAAIRTALALPSQVHCPEVWAAIKALDGDGRGTLVVGVRELLVGGDASRPGTAQRGAGAASSERL